jgi:hypothetical protein
MFVYVFKDIGDLFKSLVIFNFDLDLFFRHCIIPLKEPFILLLAQERFVHLTLHLLEVLKYLHFVLLFIFSQEFVEGVLIVDQSLIVKFQHLSGSRTASIEGFLMPDWSHAATMLL